MPSSKTPSKSSASKAAKILQNDKSSKSAKSGAAKTLAKWAAFSTRIKSAPKKGKISKDSIEQAVKSVSKSD